MRDAPSVVGRYHPRYRDIYARRGWTMFDSIDRVYDTGKAMRRLGFRLPHGLQGDSRPTRRIFRSADLQVLYPLTLGIMIM